MEEKEVIVKNDEKGAGVQDNGSGILRAYNMFPSMFGNDFEAMTEYLDVVEEMGFNAVWINPVHESETISMTHKDRETGAEIKVKNSIYAMSAAELGSEKKNSLKQFTKRAKELG